MKLTPRQIQALELTIAIAWEGRLRPKSASQAEMVRDDAKAVLAALKAEAKS